MEDSILTTTKKILGLNDDYTAFDLDIIIHINAVFATLQQIGLGRPSGFMIEDKTSKWEEIFLTPQQLNTVKTYMFLKVKSLFDPPATSYLISATNEQLMEYEWRLNVMAEEQRLEQERSEALL